ncbi:MAG: 60S ribosomal protein L28 [Promethearchaeota archaeon]
MSSDPTVITNWETIKQGHCAYKGQLTPSKITCSHLYSLSGRCGFSDCPIVQPQYVSLQRQETTLFLLEKKRGSLAEQWSEKELEGDKKAMKAIVDKKAQVLAPRLQKALMERFEILTNLIEDLRSGFGDEEKLEEE